MSRTICDNGLGASARARIDGNSAVLPGESRVAIDPDYEIRCFDRLPYRMRVLANYMPVPYAVSQILEHFRSHGADAVVERLFDKHPDFLGMEKIW